MKATLVRPMHGPQFSYLAAMWSLSTLLTCVDIVGNNIPVFFIQDAIQFPDLIHSVKPRPDNEIPQAATAHDSAWDHGKQWTKEPHLG
jgi:catalase